MKKCPFFPPWHLALVLIFFTLNVSPKAGASLKSCKKNSDDTVCLAVKYVAFADPNGIGTLNEEDAQKNLESVNSLWNACRIGFILEKFELVQPTVHLMKYQISEYSDLTAIRQFFQESNRLLIATTGPWDRAGTLGSTKANAWTSMPGSSIPYGVVIEKPVATNANLLAHELGHYLNLLHQSDTLALMNPVIFSRSTFLNSSQCEIARTAAIQYWSRMIR